jgi:hypothetical protein
MVRIGDIKYKIGELIYFFDTKYPDNIYNAEIHYDKFKNVKSLFYPDLEYNDFSYTTYGGLNYNILEYQIHRDLKQLIGYFISERFHFPKSEYNHTEYLQILDEIEQFGIDSASLHMGCSPYMLQRKLERYQIEIDNHRSICLLEDKKTKLCKQFLNNEIDNLEIK